jgi:hypothetical protein
MRWTRKITAMIVRQLMASSDDLNKENPRTAAPDAAALGQPTKCWLAPLASFDFGPRHGTKITGQMGAAASS